jgi:hypothetical protein
MQRFWQEARQTQYHCSSKMTEETSAWRWVFDHGGGIGHVFLHHMPEPRVAINMRFMEPSLGEFT